MTEKVWSFTRYQGGREVSKGWIIATDCLTAEAKLAERSEKFSAQIGKFDVITFTLSSKTPDQLRAEVRSLRDARGENKKEDQGAAG